MPRLIRVIAAAGAVFIDGDPRPVPAGTLAAAIDSSGTTITISNVMGGAALACGPWQTFADASGNGFASPAAAMAYLSATLARTESQVPTISGVAGEAITAGMPVARSRSDGTLRLARADTYALAFLAGLAATDIAAGFALEAVRSSLALPDWTAVAGTPLLAQSQRYFLAPAGGLTATPALSPVGAGFCVAAIGLATSPTTLVFQPSDPILL